MAEPKPLGQQEVWTYTFDYGQLSNEKQDTFLNSLAMRDLSDSREVYLVDFPSGMLGLYDIDYQEITFVARGEEEFKKLEEIEGLLKNFESAYDNLEEKASAILSKQPA